MTDNGNLTRDALRADLAQLELRLIEKIAAELDKKASTVALAEFVGWAREEFIQVKDRLAVVERGEHGARAVSELWRWLLPTAALIAVTLLTRYL